VKGSRSGKNEAQERRARENALVAGSGRALERTPGSVGPVRSQERYEPKGPGEPQERSREKRCPRGCRGFTAGSRAKKDVERVGNPEDGQCRWLCNAIGEYGRPRLSSAVGERNPRRGASACVCGCSREGESFEEKDNPQRGMLPASKTGSGDGTRQTRRAPPETVKVERGGPEKQRRPDRS